MSRRYELGFGWTELFGLPHSWCLMEKYLTGNDGSLEAATQAFWHRRMPEVPTITAVESLLNGHEH